jgi:RNA polymerase sigma-70 factor, ECF subfamily
VSGSGDSSRAPELRGIEDSDVVSLESALIGRAQAGDRESLRLVLFRHADALYSRIILPRVGSPSAAEDLLRATMVTAIEKLHTFHWQGRSIYYWLRQIAVNKVIDYHRANQRTLRLAQTLQNEPDFAISSSDKRGPELTLIAEEERMRNGERIQRALGEMNPRYRRAIELRLIEEHSRDECARLLEVTLGTFDVLLFRAMRAFRRSFGEP